MFSVFSTLIGKFLLYTFNQFLPHLLHLQLSPAEIGFAVPHSGHVGRVGSLTVLRFSLIFTHERPHFLHRHTEPHENGFGVLQLGQFGRDCFFVFLSFFTFTLIHLLIFQNIIFHFVSALWKL
jgi:hypothetical protein